MRAFKQKSTDRWLARLDSLDMEHAAHLAHVAQEYGIDVSDIELVETDVDPRVDPILPPARAPTPDEEELSQLDAIIAAALDGTATAAQVRQLAGRMARRLRNQGRL